MIDKEEAIKRLVKAYPPYLFTLRESLVDYVTDEGEFMWFSIVSSPLAKSVCGKFSVGDYEYSDSLFLEVEYLIKNGSQVVRDIVCTGFLESMQNQTELDGKYWAPLLGEEATAFCKAMDDFYGIKTDGLSCYCA